MAVRNDKPIERDTATSGRPLVVTGDAELLDDLLRVAATAGALVDVAPDPAAARRWFGGAPLVLVGTDLLDACARAGLPARKGVVLVGRHDATAPPDWRPERLGAEHMAALPAAEPWLVERLRECMRSGRPRGRVFAVIGGRGGAGASVLAAAMAMTAAATGLGVLLVDADPLGGGLDLVLGWESLDGLRWPSLSQTSGRVSPPVLVGALPRRGDLVVLSWDRSQVLSIPVDAMATALDAGRRGQDLVVVDLPRRLDDASMLALGVADRAFIVVPAELRACAAASRVAAAVAEHGRKLELVARGPAPGGLRGTDVAAATGLRLAGWLPAEPGLAAALERGQPPGQDDKGHLAAFCRGLISDLTPTHRESAA